VLLEEKSVAMATNMGELLQRLTEKEQELARAQQEARQLIRDASQKVSMGAHENVVLRRAQAQELKELYALNEKEIRDKTHVCRFKVQEVLRELSLTQGEQAQCEERMKKSEEHALNLTMKVQDLQAYLAHSRQQSDAEISHLESHLDGRVRQAASQGDQRVQHMSDAAMEVGSALSANVAYIQGHFQDQMHRHHVRAEGHVRLKELMNLASHRSEYEMSPEIYSALRDDLVGLWHLQGAREAHPATKAPPPSKTLSKLKSECW
ncbi:unnamed protein product, partial [Polarella glacialis]